MIWTQIDGDVYQNYHLYSKVLYDTISEVRSSLQVFDLGVQERDKCMMILDISYPMGSKYNVILVSLSKNLNITLFLLVVSPSMSASRHKLIVVNFVNNGH